MTSACNQLRDEGFNPIDATLVTLIVRPTLDIAFAGTGEPDNDD